MTMAVKLRLSALILSLLATLPQAARADASSIVSTSTVSLNNLRYELIDLNPKDGITPAVSFNIQTIVGERLAGPPASIAGPVYSGTLLPSTTVSYQSADGTSVSTATPSGFSVQSTLTLGQLQAGQDARDPSLYTAYGANALVETHPSGPILAKPATFTLTPNTALVIHGDATISQTLDATAFSQWASAAGYAQWVVSDDSSYLDITISMDYDPYAGGGRNADSYKEFWSIGNPGVDQSTAGLLQTTSASQSLDAVFTNSLATPTTASLYIQATNHSALFSRLGNTPLPEPTTYALMDLGLVGIALACRRQRR